MIRTVVGCGQALCKPRWGGRAELRLESVVPPPQNVFAASMNILATVDVVKQPCRVAAHSVQVSDRSLLAATSCCGDIRCRLLPLSQKARRLAGPIMSVSSCICNASHPLPIHSTRREHTSASHPQFLLLWYRKRSVETQTGPEADQTCGVCSNGNATTQGGVGGRQSSASCRISICQSGMRIPHQVTYLRI